MWILAAMAGPGTLSCASKALHLAGTTHPGDVWLQAGGDPARWGPRAAGPVPPLRLLWRQDAGKPPVGGPLLDGRVLLQLTGDSHVLAYDLGTGRRIGRRSFTEDWCAPLSAAGPDGRVLVAALTGDDPQVRGFDRVEGRWGWRLELPSCAAPAARGDTVVVVAETGRVQALETAGGTELWHWDGRGSLIAVPPAWRGDTLCVADSGGRVSLLRSGSGRLLWSSDVGAGVRGRPVLVGPAVYVTTSQAEVVCLEARTGQAVWRTQLDGLLTGVAASSRSLVVGSSDYSVYSLDVDSGARLWAHRMAGVVRGTPTAVGDLVYVASAGAALEVLDGGTGTTLWQWPLDGPVATPVTVGQTLVAVTTQTGSVYVFGQEEGHGE